MRRPPADPGADAPGGKAPGYLLPVPVSFAAAQARVNFVVLEPCWLPADCRLADVTLRPEQPPGRPDAVAAASLGHADRTDGNPASIRAQISGAGRSLRIKQFLYDFGPPSAGIAPLWGSPQALVLLAGDRVGWLGRDYKSRVGGCVQIDRTQVEFSVTSGEFTVAEITDLIAGLAVADAARAARIFRTSFHRLSYWVRYRKQSMGVPYGLWQYDRSRRYQHARLVAEADIARQSPVAAFLPDSARYAFDSAVCIVDEEHGHRELEAIYRHAGNGSDHLWISAVNSGSALRYLLPPRRETNLVAEIAGQVIQPRLGAVWIAAVDQQVGAAEARWEHDGVRQSVWGSPSVHQGVRAFTEMLVTMSRMEPVR